MDESKYYTYDYWHGDTNPIERYQKIMGDWYKNSVIPKLSMMNFEDGYKCYFGSHNCKNYLLWKNQFTDMIGFDLHNPTNNPWVIQFDFLEINAIKIPVSLAVPVIGSYRNTPHLIKKYIQWLDNNLVPGGVVVCGTKHRDQLTDVQTIETIYNPFKKRDFYIIRKKK